MIICMQIKNTTGKLQHLSYLETKTSLCKAPMLQQLPASLKVFLCKTKRKQDGFAKVGFTPGISTHSPSS